MKPANRAASSPRGLRKLKALLTNPAIGIGSGDPLKRGITWFWLDFLPWLRGAFIVVGFLAAGVVACLTLAKWPFVSVFIWVAIPICSRFLNRPFSKSSLTAWGIRRVRFALTLVATLLSLGIWANITDLRDVFGKAFINGYRHWPAEMREDDNGNEYYPGDNWRAPTVGGKIEVLAIYWTLAIGVLVIPVMTFSAATKALKAKEAPQK